MRRFTMCFTTVLSILILGYSYHANLTGDQGTTGNQTCTPSATAADAQCQPTGRPGENK